MHVLLNTDGISNQPFRLIDKINSYEDALAKQSYSGQYVHNSPYTLTVSHSDANALSSSAFCYLAPCGLTRATVGIPVSFMVSSLNTSIPSIYIYIYIPFLRVYEQSEF